MRRKGRVVRILTDVSTGRGGRDKIVLATYKKLPGSGSRHGFGKGVPVVKDAK